MTQPYMMARNSDPSTSHEAAQAIDVTQLEALVLNVISMFPNGCIADDVERSLPHIISHSITPRFAPLLRCGAIVDTGERRRGKSGRNQRVVMFVPEPDRVFQTDRVFRVKKAKLAALIDDCESLDLRLYDEGSDLSFEAASEIHRLRKALQYQDERMGRIGTHSPSCYTYGHRHYECALRKIKQLEDDMKFLSALGPCGKQT